MTDDHPRAEVAAALREAALAHERGTFAASIEKREPIDSLIEAMFSFPPRRGRPRTTY